MMCIKRRKEPLTIGFCQANKNRNVIPVSEATDQSSPPSSLTGCLSLSRSWQKQALTIWKGEGFLPLFKYPRVWFQCETPAPLPHVSGGPASGAQNALKHLCWIISTSRNFPTFFPAPYKSDATACKFISMNHWLIEIRSQDAEFYRPRCAVWNFFLFCFVHVNVPGRQKSRQTAVDSSLRFLFFF